MNGRIITRLGVLATCFAIVAAFLWYKNRRYSSLHGKYPIGMTIDEAKALMSTDYPAEPTAVAYDKGTRKEYEETTEYIIRVKDEHLNLHFNAYGRLIRVSPVGAVGAQDKVARPEPERNPKDDAADGNK